MTETLLYHFGITKQVPSSLQGTTSFPYSKAYRRSAAPFVSNLVFSLLNKIFQQLALQTFQCHANLFPPSQSLSFLETSHQGQDFSMAGALLRFRLQLLGYLLKEVFSYSPVQSTAQSLSVTSPRFDVIHSNVHYQSGLCLFIVDLFRDGFPAYAVKAGTLHYSPTYSQKLGLFLVPGKHFLTMCWKKKKKKRTFLKCPCRSVLSLICPSLPVPQLEVHRWVAVRAAPPPGMLWLTRTSPLPFPPTQSGQEVLLLGGFSL